MEGKTLGTLIRLKDTYVGSRNSHSVMASLGTNAVDISGLIYKGLLEGTGHHENSFPNTFFLGKLDIWFANLIEGREFRILQGSVRNGTRQRQQSG